MSDLDDAIREHLELKRKHGASEEEVTLKEREAQKQGALPSDPGAVPAEEASDAAPPGLDQSEQPEVATVGPTEPAPPQLPDEPEPDEVLPEEALELEAPPPEEPPEASEDVLEETPEFLEDMPEQDRLWFEQGPPKDFNFDD